MVTLTPSARGRTRSLRGPPLFYFILLGLFGAFSFVQMVRSKHLHDHGDTKPSLRRDGVTTTDGDIRKKGAVHDRYVVSMEHSKSENLEGNVELPRRSTAKTIRSYFTTGKKEDVEQQQQKQQAAAATTTNTEATGAYRCDDWDKRRGGKGEPTNA